MSISEISAVSPVPLRSSARITPIAARAFGPGAVRIDASSSGDRPLMTGIGGATASGVAPSRRPSSSIQCSRPPWTRVNGRRSSTLITTRFGSSRTMSARRISGNDSTRSITPIVSRRKMLVPHGMAATARICSDGTRETPRTSMLATAKLGVVRGHCSAAPPAAANTTIPSTTPSSRRRRTRRCGRGRFARPTRWPATNTERSPMSASTDARPLGELRLLGIYSPMILISFSSVIEKWFFTRSRVRSISARMSAAVAPPRFTMKFACFEEISAPLMRLPLRPHFSIIFAATSPWGFFQTQPAEARASGWVDFFTLSRCFISFWISASALRCRRRRQPIRTAPTGALKLRYVKAPGAGLNSPSEPSGCRKYTALTKSPIHPSAVPAFMARAPPIVAGMPTRHSIPPRFRAAASRISAESDTPAPAIASSPWNSARPRQPSRRSTTPRTPRSLTRRLLPPPITETGSCSRSANMSAWRMSSTSCGTTKMSAVPPMRSEVWKLNGSLNRTSPRISPSMSPSQSMCRVQALQQLRAELAHVAGAERDHEVAPTGDLREMLDDARAVAAEVRDIAMAVRPDPVGEIPARDAGDRRLAGRVDVHHDQHVSQVERREKFFPQMQGPGVAVRLKHRHDPTVESSLGGRQRSSDLGRVMPIVVDHRDASGAAQDLKAALDSRESAQRPLNGGERNLEVEPDADRRERVEYIVATRDLQGDLAEQAPALIDLEPAGHPRELQAARDQIRARLEPVRDDPLLEAREQELDIGLVQAEDGRAVEGHLVDEGDEGVADRVEGAVVVEVLGVDRCDDRDRRGELQERAVGLVGLGDEEVALAQARVRAEARHPTADDDRRVEAALGQDGADHRGGRGLAVGARDGNAVLEAHQLGEHLGAGDRRDLLPAGGLDLDVVARDRRRIDDHVRALDVAGLVADEDLRAQLREPLDGLAPLLIGARHAVAEVQEYLSYAGHADAADADEMDLLIALKHGPAGR